MKYVMENFSKKGLMRQYGELSKLSREFCSCFVISTTFALAIIMVFKEICFFYIFKRNTNFLVVQLFE